MPNLDSGPHGPQSKSNIEGRRGRYSRRCTINLFPRLYYPENNSPENYTLEIKPLEEYHPEANPPGKITHIRLRIFNKVRVILLHNIITLYYNVILYLHQSKHFFYQSIFLEKSKYVQ